MKINERFKNAQTRHTRHDQVQTGSQTRHSAHLAAGAGSNSVTPSMAEKVGLIIAELDNWKDGSNKEYATRLQWLFKQFEDRSEWRRKHKKEVMLLTHMIIGKEMEGDELLEAARMVLLHG